MSIEGLNSIVGLISSLWKCAAPEVNYIRKLEENLNALRTAMEKLKELKNDTMRRVAIAEGPQMKRLDKVQGWFSRVEAMDIEVKNLISDASKEIDKNCLGDCCPKNCRTSYKLGKTIVQKQKDVDDLEREGNNFEAVASKQPLPLVDERPSEPTVGLKSTFDEVWSYIEDEQTGIIGLYGTGGVGKTALLTQINNKLSKTTHRFEAVIWTVVSNNPNFVKVQEDIGKKIGFRDEEWKDKSQEEKALDIFGVLSKKKFVLFLDDVWKRFDLIKVGIPLPDEQNKSKAVFTTRSEDVCGEMEAHKKIKVKSLVWDEAWDLFRKKVGEDTINFHPEIQVLAKTVARECDGLPLALITIGRTMAYKRTPQEWRYAITMLQKSDAKFSSMGDKVYSRLKFSYDNLHDDILKSCFLYCSLFPEDYLISKEGLIEYWIGEGFLGGFDDLIEAQNKGQYVIGTLIHACLLEDDLSSNVKMHDVIRDMALWIACECGEVKNKILVQARVGLKRAPEIGKWEEVERMSLMSNGIEELTETPACPSLLTLFLNENELKMITYGFFQNMPNLRVLDLSHNNNLSELPKEIFELLSLQYLNLSYTSIVKLPIECKKLIELKYLNFEHTSCREVIPVGVLSSLKKLCVLKMAGSGSLDLFGEDIEFETLMKEVECLKELNELTITIRTTSTFSCFLSYPKLPTITTKLSLISLRGSEHVNISRLQSMRCLHVLQMYECRDVKDLIVERANLEVCFHGLHKVDLCRCGNLRELTWLIFAPNLESLTIEDCGIEEVICGGKWGEVEEEGGYLNPFAKLKELCLIDLLDLKSIYPNALPFPCLKSILEICCPNLKKLPLNSESAKGCGLVIEGDEDWWNNLEWEDEATRNAFLSSFQYPN